MTTNNNLQALEDALKKNCLDVAGNIYTIGVDDIMAYIEGDLALEDPQLAAQVAALDETSLAIEIADCIGSVGIVEFVEGAIRDAICVRATRSCA
ncbi:MAG: hypothetical protein HYR70_04525 [Chloroflexi bacterium]|nr:hypothetical protein [Chloroflexota bacterium]MBI1856353.1 hypothetical protein [Chloroflexota bacterium]MBI3340822.1 hypothetical protein [Chloroflexota bacterium]